MEIKCTLYAASGIRRADKKSPNKPNCNYLVYITLSNYPCFCMYNSLELCYLLQRIVQQSN